MVVAERSGAFGRAARGLPFARRLLAFLRSPETLQPLASDLSVGGPEDTHGVGVMVNRAVNRDINLVRDAALVHIRETRALRPGKWFEIPKTMLWEAAHRASGWIAAIEADRAA